MLACTVGAGCRTDHRQMLDFLATSVPAGGGAEYVVMPPDQLTISARPTEEFNRYAVRVGPDGKTFLPLLGNYVLAGKTTSQIAAELTESLLDYYEDVQVTVTVTGYNSQRFYVFGEVSRPGVYPYTGNDSFLSALAMAQPTKMAMPQKISVIRGLDPLPGEEGLALDQEGHIKNTSHRITVNLATMIKGNTHANFMIANNDVIYVPPTPFAKVGYALQQVLFPIQPLIGTVSAPQDLRSASSSGGGQ